MPRYAMPSACNVITRVSKLIRELLTSKLIMFCCEDGPIRKYTFALNYLRMLTTYLIRYIYVMNSLIRSAMGRDVICHPFLENIQSVCLFWGNLMKRLSWTIEVEVTCFSHWRDTKRRRCLSLRLQCWL